jgi:hypothetical protein
MDSNFPVELQQILGTLPINLDRRAAAAAITKYIFPVSHRTLERWPVATRRVNGRAVGATKDWLAAALAIYNASVEIAGHQASATGGAQ